MDINDARAAVTLLSLILFLGIVFWAWSSRRRSGFDEAARVPFLEADATPDSAGDKQ